MSVTYYISQSSKVLLQGARNSGSPFKWAVQQADNRHRLESDRFMPSSKGVEVLNHGSPQSAVDKHFSPLRQALAGVVSPVTTQNGARRQGTTLLPSANMGTMKKMTLPKGTMSKAMASMTMTMRRAGLGTLKPFAELPTGRLGEIPPNVASAGKQMPSKPIF